MTRELPPHSCCMCGSADGLKLQYKVGMRPWTDAEKVIGDGATVRYRISKLASCLRWLCGEHWHEDHGRFSMRRLSTSMEKFWNFREHQNRVKTGNPKRLLD